MVTLDQKIIISIPSGLKIYDTQALTAVSLYSLVFIVDKLYCFNRSSLIYNTFGNLTLGRHQGYSMPELQGTIWTTRIVG